MRLWLLGVTAVSAFAACAPAWAGDRSGRGTSPSSDVWLQRVHRFVEQCQRGQQEEAKKEFLAYGRVPGITALRRLVKDLPRDHLQRTEAGYMLYILDLDRALGRSVLVDACRPGVRPESLGETFSLVTNAYEGHRDRRLLEAVLNLVPYADGGVAGSVHGFLQQTARNRPRDLLAALTKQSPHVWMSVTGGLLCSLCSADGKTTPTYPLLEGIARQPKDPLRPTALRLFRTMDRIKRETKAILAAELRQEAQRFPLVPKGLTLPKSAVDLLRSRYPRWHILGTAGFDDAVIADVHRRFGDQAGPQHCGGDFDGNGLPDVALLIRSNEGPSVELVALRQVKPNRWTLGELSSFDFGSGFQGGYSRFTRYITPRPPGRVTYWSDGGKSKRLNLEHDGVEFSFYGKASLLYYWTGKGYAVVQTGD